MTNKKFENDRNKLVAQNKKAWHEYHIEDKFEAGIVLQGTEVKSCREGKAGLIDSYAAVKDGEIYLYKMHISPYDQGNIWNHDERRTRKLLLHKKEIKKIDVNVKQKGYTLVPLRVYFKDGKVKIEIGLARGKKNYDKREDMKQQDMQRDMDRHFRGNN